MLLRGLVGRSFRMAASEAAAAASPKAAGEPPTASPASSASEAKAPSPAAADAKPPSPVVDQTHIPPKRKGKKRKWALLLAYSGKGYFGMQLQRDVKTIEAELLQAMCKAGAMTPTEAEKPSQECWFQRASRTDKGVSALRQVVSVFLPLLDVEAKELPAALNSHLPPTIRALAVKRATRSWDSKKACDSRRYSYTLPTFAFAHLDEVTDAAFRLSAQRQKEVNDLLGHYVGTHNFFNYTSRREHDLASCQRYIKSFVCGQPWETEEEVDGSKLELVTLTVHGQSFMLNQIRKMVGMTIAIVRGFASVEELAEAWEAKRVDVPKAPGLGLVLEQPHYQGYDRKHGSDHEPLNSWEECEAAVEEFRHSVVLPEIIRTEISERSMMTWLGSLLMRGARDAEEARAREEADAQAPDDESQPKRPRLSLPEIHRSDFEEKLDKAKKAEAATVAAAAADEQPKKAAE